MSGSAPVVPLSLNRPKGVDESALAAMEQIAENKALVLFEDLQSKLVKNSRAVQSCTPADYNAAVAKLSAALTAAAGPYDTAFDEFFQTVTKKSGPAAGSGSAAAPAATPDAADRLVQKYKGNSDPAAEAIGYQSHGDLLGSFQKSDDMTLFHLQGLSKLDASMRLSEKEWRALKQILCEHPINDGGICDFEHARHKLLRMKPEDVFKVYNDWVVKKQRSYYTSPPKGDAKTFLDQFPAKSFENWAKKTKDEQKKEILEIIELIHLMWNRWVDEPYRYVTRPDGSKAKSAKLQAKMVRAGVLPDKDLRRDFMRCLMGFPDAPKEKEVCKDMPSSCCENLSNEESNFAKENCAELTADQELTYTNANKYCDSKDDGSKNVDKRTEKYLNQEPDTFGGKLIDQRVKSSRSASSYAASSSMDPSSVSVSSPSSFSPLPYTSGSSYMVGRENYDLGRNPFKDVDASPFPRSSRQRLKSESMSIAEMGGLPTASTLDKLRNAQFTRALQAYMAGGK